MPNRLTALAKAEAALRSQATRTAVLTIKTRARAFADRPAALEPFCPGLSLAAPERIVAAGAQLIAAETAAPRRWFGFGGEVPLLNAKAVMLFGRALRRAAAKRRRARA